jgi:hypothetical protein
MAVHSYLAGRVDQFHDQLETRSVSFIKSLNGSR